MTPKKMNNILWVVLVALIVTLGAGLYFANQIGTKLANNTNKLRAEAQINQKKLEIYRVSKERSETLDYVDDLAEQILPGDHNQSATIAEISQFASRASLGVADITFDLPNAEDAKAARKKKDEASKALPKGVEVVPVTLSLQEGARYNNILEFLETMENNRRKMQVVNVSLTPSEDNRNVFEQVIFRINIYARQDSAQEAKDED